MSILGLCFSRDNKIRSAQLLSELKNYQILSSDNNNYADKVIDTDDYVCYCKYNKESTLNQISIHTDSGGNQILLFGENWYIDNVISRKKNFNVIDEIDNITKSDGEYNCIIMEKQLNKIHFINDRFSSRPCFYYDDGNNFFLSTNVSFIVKYFRGKINYDLSGILQLLNFSHTLEQKTIYQNINRMLPATHMIVDKKKADIQYYWSIKYEYAEIKNIRAYAKKVIDVFKESTTKCTSQRPGFCSLSGGLDSRMVAASISSPSYFAFTFADSLTSGESMEVKVASEVASILNMRHKILQLKNDTLSKYIKDIILLTGGLIPVQHPIKTMQQINEMKKGGCFKVGGGPGDVLAGSYVPSANYMNANKKKKLLKAFVLNRKMLSDKMMSRFLKKQVCVDHLKNIVPIFLDSFNKIDEPTLAQKVTIWAMKVRQPAFTFNSPIHNHPDVSERSPHLGYRYCDLMLQLSPRNLVNKDFYHYMIYSQFPKLQNVIYANTGKTIESSLIRRKRNKAQSIGMVKKGGATSIIRFLSRYPVLFVKIKKIVNENYFIGRFFIKNSRCFLFDLLKADKDLLDETKKILSESLRLNDIFMVQNCISFIDNFCKGDIQYNKNLDAHIIGCLITMSFADKILLDGSKE